MDITKVVELTSIKQTSNTLVLGANTTITKAMDIFTSVSTIKGFRYLARVRDHLDLVAHIAVRNVSNTLLKWGIIICTNLK